MSKRAMRGVNLGGWLVLEPWITPSLFKGTGAKDEYTYCSHADIADAGRMERLKRHRQTFITAKDFKWLADNGIEAVRIPVGYWVFGDVEPYQGTVEYLDKAFGWAEKYGLKVLICLHGVPGSQNGTMHSGQIGSVEWATRQEYLNKSWQVVDRLSDRYAKSTALLGVEVLNEPAQEILRRVLLLYYRKCYRIIRGRLGREAWMVFDDRFKPLRWWWVMAWPFRRQVYLDSHQYQIFTAGDRALDMAGHLAKTRRVGRLLRWIGRYRHLIVGEWSAALHPQSLGDLKGKELDDAYRRYIQTQLQAYGSADAWFYWTYRREGGGPWSFRDMVEQGIFPPLTRL